jgi:hypothetical protein
MKRTSGKTLIVLALLAVSVGLWTPDAALGRKDEWAVPVVMEEATVRGKVVILETRQDDRKTIANLPIEVWETEKNNPGVKRKLRHETTTDDGGLFSLPLLETGQYILIVSELRLSLTVIPQNQIRAGQGEPKILLILLPKDVV